LSLNWRKGFHRVFALAAVVWAGYVLFVYPMQKNEEAFDTYISGIVACGQMTPPRDTECKKNEEKLWQDTVALHPVPGQFFSRLTRTGEWRDSLSIGQARHLTASFPRHLPQLDFFPQLIHKNLIQYY